MSARSYPEEKVLPDSGLMDRAMRRNFDRETSNSHELNIAKRPKKRAVMYEDFDQDDLAVICPDRTDGFFESNDTIKLGTNIFIRSYYSPTKSQHFVYFMKKNQSPNNPQVDNTYLNVSDFELPQLIQILKTLIAEIDSTPRGKLVKRLQNSEYATITDFSNPLYWSDEFTEKLGYLKIRPLRDFRGSYALRIIRPKESKYSWAGPSMTMPLGLAKEFVAILEKQLQFINGDTETTVSEDESSTESESDSQHVMEAA